MVPSRQVIACILLILGVATCAHAQSPAKEQTASISGKVTVKNKGVAGIVVVAVENNQGRGSRARHRATTDDEGNYRISELPAGNYYAYPLAPALAVDKGQSTRSLTVAPGESIRDLDFTMVRGGVITGRITNADGQPLVEENVNVVPIDYQPHYLQHDFRVHTDDRGIYRAFGLRHGKYRVSVGQPARGLPMYIRQASRQTFYPSVTEIDKATVIEVTEGSETNDIDIVAAGPILTFTVSGRVVDGAGKPVSGVMFGVLQISGDSTTSVAGIEGSNSKGEFKLQNVFPGKYKLFVAPAENSDLRADPVPFEVIDSDLTGLEVKTKKGASLSGRVVVEGSPEETVAPKLKGLRVFASLERSVADYESGSRSIEVAADGSFKLAGLASGIAHLSFIDHEGSDARQFEIVQIEHNGMPQPSGISVKDGELIDGVRIVVRHLKLTGSIRGQVKIENGELPQAARVMVYVNFADPLRRPRMSLPAPEVDSRGRFLLERIAAGTYEVRAAVYELTGKRLSLEGPKQVITVTDNAATEITVPIKLKQ